MKMLISLFLITINLNAFAGPEDHISQQTCYEVNESQKALLSANVPSRVCLERLSIDQANNTIAVQSYFQPELFRGLELQVFFRQNEDYFKFQATNLLVDQNGSGCEESEKVELSMSGLMRFDHAVQLNELDISVRRDLQVDSCHSKLQSEVFHYHVE